MREGASEKRHLLHYFVVHFFVHLDWNHVDAADCNSKSSFLWILLYLCHCRWVILQQPMHKLCWWRWRAFCLCERSHGGLWWVPTGSWFWIVIRSCESEISVYTLSCSIIFTICSVSPLMSMLWTQHRSLKFAFRRFQSMLYDPWFGCRSLTSSQCKLSLQMELLLGENLSFRKKANFHYFDAKVMSDLSSWSTVSKEFALPPYGPFIGGDLSVVIGDPLSCHVFDTLLYCCLQHQQTKKETIPDSWKIIESISWYTHSKVFSFEMIASFASFLVLLLPVSPLVLCRIPEGNQPTAVSSCKSSKAKVHRPVMNCGPYNHAQSYSDTLRLWNISCLDMWW